MKVRCQRRWLRDKSRRCIGDWSHTGAHWVWHGDRIYEWDEANSWLSTIGQICEELPQPTRVEDPVDAGARTMFNMTRDYVMALQRGENPSPIPMLEATTAYAKAVDHEVGESP